jgi:uncharacterized membrane protein YhfC
MSESGAWFLLRWVWRTGEFAAYMAIGSGSQGIEPEILGVISRIEMRV